MVRNPFRRTSKDASEAELRSAMPSRDAFVREVAQTIRQRHATGAESFVFGLSGRWGEGKTFFLDQLRKELKEDGLEVIDLNPWKYATDRVAFLRSFLLQLLESQTRAQRITSAWRALRAPGRISARAQRFWEALDLLGLVTRRRLRVDVSRQSISWIRLAVLIPVFYWLYALVLPSAGAEAQLWQKLLAAIPVGLAIWLVQGLVASQVSTKAATALDDFDRIVQLALGANAGIGNAGDADRRVVVFVDDLDRVTARVARDVLDNLRTFFDKPALSFVVTGDHEVLEANLGAELVQEESSLEERKETGRLFLKKIFNVYWRLPKPVPSDFRGFVDGLLSRSAGDLTDLLMAEEDRAKFREWLLHYSGDNLRQVERTLDTVLFSLRVVGEQRQTAVDERQQRLLTQMAEEPMLLVRVLFIQDQCAPLFEMFVDNAELLYDFDVAIHDARVTGGPAARTAVAEFLKSLEGGSDGSKQLVLTAPQRAFLTRFMYEQPSFHDPARGGKYVASVAPWVHLACDAGLEDSAGPRPEDALRSIENANREALHAQLDACSETRADEVALKVVDSLASADDVSQRVERLQLVLEELAAASPQAPLVRRVTDMSQERLDGLLAGVSDSQRVAIMFALLAVLQEQGFQAIPEGIKQHLAFRGFGDLQSLERAQLGALQSVVVISWLRAAYEHNQADALPSIEELAPYLSLEGAPETPMAELMTRVREDLLADESDARRSVRLQLLSGYAEGELSALKAEVLESVMDESVWRWASAEADGTHWALSELEAALLDAVVRGVADSQTFIQGLAYSVGKLNHRAEELWTRIQQTGDDHLLGRVDSLVAREDLGPLVPPADIATRLYEQLAEQVWGLAQEDEQAAVNRVRLLDPRIWLWRKVDKHSAWKALGPLADRRRRFVQLQAVAGPFRTALYAD